MKNKILKCLKSVESSNIAKIGYICIKDSINIYVQFKNNDIYEYENVSFDDYWNLINAPSIGKEFINFRKIYNGVKI